MISVLFLDDQKEVVEISFTHNADLNPAFDYGTWNTNTNQVDLTDRGWEMFRQHRNNIRQLEPMMRKLIKIPAVLGDQKSC